MTLKELFTNIANAIRSATGTKGTIKAADFAKKISAIIYRGVAVQGTDSGQNAHGVYYHIPSGYYNEDGTNSWVYRPLSDFGNAKASDVLRGKTFTSSSGLRVTGNATASLAEVGKGVVNGRSDKSISATVGHYIATSVVRVNSGATRILWGDGVWGVNIYEVTSSNVSLHNGDGNSGGYVIFKININ